MDTSPELEMMKAGARRMQTFLAERGLEVSHAVMLEALSAGFGSRNWRTVRDKLNSAVTTVNSAKTSALRTWQVFGVYRDNAQAYHDYYEAGSAHEAHVKAYVERLFDEWGSELKVTHVVDCAAVSASNRTYSFESPVFDCARHSEALRVVTSFARACHGTTPPPKVLDVHGWFIRSGHLDVFESELGDKALCELLDEMDKFTRDNPGFNRNHEFSWKDSRNMAWEGLTGSKILKSMLYIIDGQADVDSLGDDLKTHIYHARALLTYASKELDSVIGQ